MDTYVCSEARHTNQFKIPLTHKKSNFKSWFRWLLIYTMVLMYTINYSTLWEISIYNYRIPSFLAVVFERLFSCSWNLEKRRFRTVLCVFLFCKQAKKSRQILEPFYRSKEYLWFKPTAYLIWFYLKHVKIFASLRLKTKYESVSPKL